MRGSLYISGFASKFAVRAQVRLQLLVSVSLLPTVSQKNKAMLTGALLTAAPVCQKQMTRGSVAKPVPRNTGRVCTVGA